jgi:hypothetical protein
MPVRNRIFHFLSNKYTVHLPCDQRTQGYGFSFRTAHVHILGLVEFFHFESKNTKLSILYGPNFSVSNEIFEYGHASSECWVEFVIIKENKIANASLRENIKAQHKEIYDNQSYQNSWLLKLANIPCR